MAISSTLVANTNTTIYTSTVSGTQIGNAITCLMFCNYTPSTAATVTVYVVVSAGSASNTNMIINALSIPGGETVSLDQEKLVLGSGDFIVAVASVNTTITSTISTLPV
jgi:hypothetical protein